MNFICDALEVIIVTICFFLLKKYVFLEKDLPKKLQRYFYLATAATVGAIFLIFGNTAAEILASTAVGLNIILVREKPHKLKGLFMILPLFIINCIMVPLMVVPPYLLSIDTQVYQLAVYGILVAAFAAFMIFGRKWRERFVHETKDRSLSLLERVVAECCPRRSP